MYIMYNVYNIHTVNNHSFSELLQVLPLRVNENSQYKYYLLPD